VALEGLLRPSRPVALLRPYLLGVPAGQAGLLRPSLRDPAGLEALLRPSGPVSQLRPYLLGGLVGREGLLLLSRPVAPEVRAGLGLPVLPEGLVALESLDPPWPLEAQRAPHLPRLLAGLVALEFPDRLLRPEDRGDLVRPWAPK
jgi:hypothetical protein